MTSKHTGSVTPMDFRAHLRAEFDRRRAKNPRYSLRAFARQLGTHHTTVSRLMNERRRLTARRLKSLGARLGLTARQVNGACLHENMERLAALVGRAGFRPDARWIAARTGLTLGEVQVALHYLIYTGRLKMTAATTWTLEPVR
jgi:transcriptional regulator with XRE-family HTH domain